MLVTSSFRPSKIGDIKKTVAAFSLQHGVYTQLKPPSLNTLKSCKTKTNPKFGGALFSRTSEFSTHQNNLILAFHQFEASWLPKTMAVIPRLYKEDFALTIFESEAKHRFCFRGCRSVLDQTARIWLLCLLSWGGLQDDVIKYKPPWLGHPWVDFLTTIFYNIKRFTSRSI